MKRVTWIVETGVFSQQQDTCLEKEILKQGHNVFTFPQEDSFKLSFDIFSDHPIVFHGSLRTARRVIAQSKWTPGAYLDSYYNRRVAHNFYCSTYYTYFGEWMLNADYRLMSLGEFNRRAGYFYGLEDKFFMRPDSPFKEFHGDTYCRAKLESKIPSLPPNLNPEMLVLISTEKAIDYEARFFVANGKAITGSTYVDRHNDPWASIRSAGEFAEEVLNKVQWQPDSLYMLDVCRWEREWYVVEINSFSCSGLYTCDIEKVVKCASQQAIQDWEAEQ